MPMRRSSLHGLAGGINLGTLQLQGDGGSPSSPAASTDSPKGVPSGTVNSLAIAAARSKRRIRRAAPAGGADNSSSPGEARGGDAAAAAPGAKKASPPRRRLQPRREATGDVNARRTTDINARRAADAERRQRTNMARLRKAIPGAARRASLRTEAMMAAAAADAAQASPPAASPASNSRRTSAEAGKLLFAAAAAAATTAAGADPDRALRMSTAAAAAAAVPLNSPKGVSSSPPSTAEAVGDGDDVQTPTGLSQLQILQPHQHWRCVDHRGANFRLKPDPGALVGDGSGVDPGETVRVVARTKNWLKIDTTHMRGVLGSRWVPLRMYWGDNKQLFAVSKQAPPPATSPRVDVETVRLTLPEFNNIRFSAPTKEGFPQIVGFGDGGQTHRPMMVCKSGHRLLLGMALLTVGKWSLVRSRFAAVAAMLNARPDGDTVVLEAKFRLPLLAAMDKSI